MLLARIVVALLALLQPLPALGLEVFLPCPQGCAHCAGDQDPAESSCGCGSPPEQQEPSCPCWHEAQQPEPCAPAPAPERCGEPVLRESAWPAFAIESWIAGACARATGLGHDPPPRLAMLCVWRN